MAEQEYCPLVKFMIKLFAPGPPKKQVAPLVVPTLPAECMQQIFQNIVDQGESLYSFLFINRYWCRNVVPFLWARPFDGLLPENKYKIMQVYLSSLNDAEKMELKDLLKSYDMELPELRKTLFNYPMMLQEFSFKNLEMIVHSWIYRWNMDYERYGGMREMLGQMNLVLCKLFLRSSVNLQNFKVDKFSSHDDISDITLCLHNVTHAIGLHNITKLEIDHSTQPMMKNTVKLLEAIPKLCKRIRRLDVKIPIFENNRDIVRAIVSIIRSQEKLKEFSLEGVGSKESHDIILALQAHSRTLTSVKFDSIEITTSSLYELTKCESIQDLSMMNCRKLTIHDVTNTVTTTPTTIDGLWDTIKFKKLKRLNIINSPRNPLIPSAIIRSAGNASLRELTFDVITPETINSTIENCPNITHLTLLNYIPSRHDSLLNSLFQNLNCITHLTIQIPFKPISSSESSIISGKSLPPSLIYLKLQCGFTTVQLDNLLSDCCKAKLKVLIVDIAKILYMDLKVITRFVKERRSVKFLGIGGMNNWNGKETKELDELKERFGVYVIPWYEVDKW